MPPVLNQINLVVADLPAATAFYRRLGVEMPDGEVHVQAEFPGVSLELDDATSAQWWHAAWRASPGPRAVLTFQVEDRSDVDSIYGDLTSAGYEGHQPPSMRSSAHATRSWPIPTGTTWPS